MSNTIYKYELKLEDRAVVHVPRLAQLLSIQEQHGTLQAWFLVDRDQTEMDRREFAIYGTGSKVPANPGLYRATVQVGAYVWHVFEVNQ